MKERKAKGEPRDVLGKNCKLAGGGNAKTLAVANVVFGNGKYKNATNSAFWALH